MTSFYHVGDDCIFLRGSPWAKSIVAGLHNHRQCEECGAHLEEPQGTVQVRLDPRKGVKWPDTFGCGRYPLFIVSDRVLANWRTDGVGAFPAQRIEIVPPLPTRLTDTNPPAYSWIDGTKMLGARMDFEASGFVDVSFCSACGTRSDDIVKTHRRQHATAWPSVLMPGTWNGANLFTTDLSSAAFFCTDVVVECARRHKHTNFRFVPIERGQDPSARGIKYVKR